MSTPDHDDDVCDGPTRIVALGSPAAGAAFAEAALAAVQTPRLDGVVVAEVLGVGGGGVVFAGHRLEDGREVAIKVLRPEYARMPDMVERFVREAEAATQIRHRNIVELLGHGTLADGRPYYVMERAAGESLHWLIGQQGRLSLALGLSIARSVAEALQAAHAVSIIHRDLKSSNVMVNASVVPPQVKLLDFGVAKLLHSDAKGLTADGAIIGSITVMAPEQIRCEPVDGRTDIYALGVLLYQMLTGTYPFWSTHAPELLQMHLESPPRTPSEIVPLPSVVDRLVLRCLAKRPVDRFADMGAVLAELDACEVESRSDAARPEAMVVAVLAMCWCRGGWPDDADDSIYDDVVSVQNLVEDMFHAAGFSTALTTASAVLGIRLPPDADDLVHAQTLAEALWRELLERDGADPRLQVGVIVHRDHARLEGGSVVGGPVLELASWTPAPPLLSVVYTGAAMASEVRVA